MLSARPQLEPQEVLTLMQSSARAFPTSGAGNDENGVPVPMCHAPDGTDQLQCYCSVGLCGAGMVDADAAVLAATGTLARIGLEPAAPVVGDRLRLSAAGSLVASGRSIVSYEWALTANPGVVDGFRRCHQRPGGRTADRRGRHGDREPGAPRRCRPALDGAAQTSSVADAPVPDAPAAAGGGGASSVLWVGLLALAVGVLLHGRRRSAAARGKTPPR